MVGRPGKYATLFGGRQEEVSICQIKHGVFLGQKKKHEKNIRLKILQIKEITFDLSL